LKSGECDAVPLGQPDDLIAVKDGYRRLGLSTEAVASFQFEVLTGTSDDIARATLALYLDPDRGVLPQHAEIDLGGLAQVIAFMGEGGAIKPPLPAPEQFVDRQYLRAAGAQ
jgi:hypothetical protein